MIIFDLWRSFLQYFSESNYYWEKDFDCSWIINSYRATNCSMWIVICQSPWGCCCLILDRYRSLNLRVSILQSSLSNFTVDSNFDPDIRKSDREKPSYAGLWQFSHSFSTNVPLWCVPIEICLRVQGVVCQLLEQTSIFSTGILG